MHSSILHFKASRTNKQYKFIAYNKQNSQYKIYCLQLSNIQHRIYFQVLLISKYGRKDLKATLDTKTSRYIFNSLKHSNITEHTILMPQYLRTCHCYTNTQQTVLHSCKGSFQKFNNIKRHSQKTVTQFTVINKTLHIDPQTQYLNLHNHKNYKISIKVFKKTKSPNLSTPPINQKITLLPVFIQYHSIIQYLMSAEWTNFEQLSQNNIGQWKGKTSNCEVWKPLCVSFQCVSFWAAAERHVFNCLNMHINSTVHQLK